MRIGVDMMALQSPESRGRGVGRYAEAFLRALMARLPESTFLLYAHDGLPTEAFPYAPNAQPLALTIDPREGETRLRHPIARRVRDNPDRCDLFLVLNPFELRPGYWAPPRPPGGAGVVAIVYDFIPFLFQERYLTEPRYALRMYRRLDDLRHYDRLLAISESTRRDAIQVLGLSESRVVYVGAAASSETFVPPAAATPNDAEHRILERLGIDRPFVLAIGAADPRKNVRGAIEAFGLLSAAVRERFQLVVTGSPIEPAGSVRWVGTVSDDALRVLYQRCATLLCPSRYEGFDLPALEAMRCGAPVIASANSSHPEVVGEGGILVPTGDSRAMAQALERLLTDPAWNARQRDAARQQAERFTWEAVADRAAAAIARTPTARVPRPATRRSRAGEGFRIALVTPLPPKPSGVGDYALRLIDALRDRDRVEVYHEPGYVPHAGLARHDLPCFDARLLPKRLRHVEYDAVLYQMGNSTYHHFLYPLLQELPGIVTLHDFSLAAFQYWRSHAEGGDAEGFVREVAYAHPERLADVRCALDRMRDEPGGIAAACNRRGLFLNRRVFEVSRAVIVHSPWCLDRVAEIGPGYLAKTVLIPHGADPSPVVGPAERRAIRERLGLPADGLMLGSFGILTRDKMNAEAIAAFAAVAAEFPTATLHFVGEDWESGEASRAAAASGVAERIHFHGRVADDRFQELIRACDVGIALRRPPTHGETSGALLHLLRAGLPVIATDAGTFGDLPEGVVRRVRWGSEGLPGLVAALRELAGSPTLRAALGERAVAHIRRHHAWSAVATQYRAVIEQTRATTGSVGHFAAFASIRRAS